MPILQFHLKPGRQNVLIPNEILDTRFKVKEVAFHYNVARHGFYQAKVYMDFLPPNNATNNQNKNRTVLFSCNHDKSYTRQMHDLDLGTFSIPRASIFHVDLDSGHQVVPESQTKVGQPYSFKPDEFDTLNEFDYVNRETNNQNFSNYAVGQFVSLGLNADHSLRQSIFEATLDKFGKLQGPAPFLYSMVLTLEYEDRLF